MSGEDEGKQLLRRILPSGLIEYLKFGSISDDQSCNLDQLEEEFYGSRYKQSLNSPSEASEREEFRSPIKSRLRERILAASNSRRTQITVNDIDLMFHNCEEAPEERVNSENFRIMFHAMTQNHSLPDLIWNEQTRLELRDALEMELADLEKEQRRHIGKRIAWNYTQFRVCYESLDHIPRVGSIYLHPFLDAGHSFVVSLGNHEVLFEKLIRRVLVNVEKDASLAVICARCLCKLYKSCRDSIGSFDDMSLLLRLMDRASDIELQHYLLELVERMSYDPTNLIQFLDKDIVNILLKFASLAHLNPDQIGNMLARLTTKILLLTDVPPENTDGLSSIEGNSALTVSGQQQQTSKSSSSWLPDDTASPALWYICPPSSNMPPPLQSIQGPFRVSDLRSLVDNGSLTRSWFVAPSSAEDYFENQYESVVDTGVWKPICEYFQVQKDDSKPFEKIIFNILCAVASPSAFYFGRTCPPSLGGKPSCPLHTISTLCCSEGHKSLRARVLSHSSEQASNVLADTAVHTRTINSFQ